MAKSIATHVPGIRVGEGETYQPHDRDRFEKIKVARREELVKFLLSMIARHVYDAASFGLESLALA